MSSKKSKNTKTAKKDYKYVWLSLILVLFFWVPLINIILLPASMYFGVKAMLRARRKPEKYGGFLMALFITIFAFVSFIVGGYILIFSIMGKI